MVGGDGGAIAVPSASVAIVLGGGSVGIGGAIANYNDKAPSNDDRWYIGSVTLSSVSGCNRQAVGDWIKSHQHIVDDHNNKYGLGQYHNKRHRGIEITNKVKLWE